MSVPRKGRRRDKLGTSVSTCDNFEMRKKLTIEGREEEETNPSAAKFVGNLGWLRVRHDAIFIEELSSGGHFGSSIVVHQVAESKKRERDKKV